MKRGETIAIHSRNGEKGGLERLKKSNLFNLIFGVRESKGKTGPCSCEVVGS